MAIDIGSEAIARTGFFLSGTTIINLENPANESGTITSLELHVDASLSDCKVGTFSRNGNNFTCRDYEVIGSVPSGSKQIFSVSITCLAGDYIGIFFSGGQIDRNTSGYPGIYTKSGDHFEAGEQTYNFTADHTISAYGTGGSVVDYYFNYSGESWDSYPDYMTDNLLTTYAFTSSDGDVQMLTVNNCPGTNLGTISKVEIRLYAYGDGNDRIDVKPYFGITGGDTYQTTPGTGPPGTWGNYIDITTDTNAPSPWTWNDISSLNAQAIKENVAKGNAMYCAKVEIRVTYTPTGGVTRSHGYIFG